MDIWFLRRESARFEAEFSRHAEMESEPVTATEAEEHLFAVGVGGLQGGAGERAGEPCGVDATKDAALGVEENAVDAMPEGGIPLLAEVVDLGEFGHGDKIRAEWQFPIAK